ncbi:MAG: hypothetical protein IJH09_02755 [Clostridia bacterium]|nr:hypothetical protein [Clostridia bacterium]
MKNKANDSFGINIRRYCREHEAEINAGTASLEQHLDKLRWLQHERLVHLIVLVMVVIVELFTVDLAVLHPETNPLAVIMMIALAVLLGFYFLHYFFLENTVQRWYRLADQLRGHCAEVVGDMIPPPAAVQEDIRAIQDKLMDCARVNQGPRTGA